MARGLAGKIGARGTSSRRVRGWVVLFGLFLSGCANIEGSEPAYGIDILVLTTDQGTTDELVGRMEGVETLQATREGEETWIRGHLIGMRDGSFYSILVGRMPERNGAPSMSELRSVIDGWRPRYVLLVGTALAVANEAPLGAVGIVPVVCAFDLDRFEESRDIGRCYRTDRGLFAAALSLADQWEESVEMDESRSGCSPARVIKLSALSGDGDPSPDYVEVATDLSRKIHRGLVVEREGALASEAVEIFRHGNRAPVGFLMIRGVSETRSPDSDREEDRAGEDAAQRSIRKACAARDTADFAADLIRYRWPVSSRADR